MEPGAASGEKTEQKQQTQSDMQTIGVGGT
jgi:hypothetical protein